MSTERPPELALPAPLRPHAGEFQHNLITIYSEIARLTPLARLRGRPMADVIDELPSELPLLAQLRDRPSDHITAFEYETLSRWAAGLSSSEQQALASGLQSVDELIGLEGGVKLLYMALGGQPGHPGTQPPCGPPSAETTLTLLDQGERGVALLNLQAALWPVQRPHGAPTSFWNALCEVLRPSCQQMQRMNPSWHSGPDRPWLPEHLRHTRHPGRYWIIWAGTHAQTFFGDHQ